MQNKGLKFEVLDTNSRIKKVEHHINRRSFGKLDANPSPTFKENANNWREKWSDNITDEWKEFIKPNNCNASEVYGKIKTRKFHNPLPVITRGCNIDNEKFSIKH